MNPVDFFFFCWCQVIICDWLQTLNAKENTSLAARRQSNITLELLWVKMKLGWQLDGPYTHWFWFFLAFDSRKTVRLVNAGIVRIGNSRAFPVTTSQKRLLWFVWRGVQGNEEQLREWVNSSDDGWTGILLKWCRWTYSSAPTTALSWLAAKRDHLHFLSSRWQIDESKCKGDIRSSIDSFTFSVYTCSGEFSSLMMEYCICSAPAPCAAQLWTKFTENEIIEIMHSFLLRPGFNQRHL